MPIENLEARIRKIAADQSCRVHVDQIKNENLLVSDLDFDSLDEVEFVMSLEDEFNIQIDDETARKFKTVQDAIDHVKTHEKS